MVPGTSATTAVCATRYIEGGNRDVGECFCHTYSIGRCGVCNEEVCGDHSDLFDGTRLCATHVAEARAEAAKNLESARISISRYLDIAEKAGYPGIQSWEILSEKQVSVEKPRRRGPRTVAERRRRTIRGWILTLGGSRGPVILTDDGDIHRCRYPIFPGPHDTAEWYDWRNTRVVHEKNVQFGWGTTGLGAFSFGTPERLDEALRILLAEIGLPP